MAFATVDKFAARLGVSPSTIVRFAYRIGLSGYPELQEQVRELVLKGLRSDGTSGEDVAAHLGNTVFAESLRHDIEILDRTAARLDPDDLDRAVDLIVKARARRRRRRRNRLRDRLLRRCHARPRARRASGCSAESPSRPGRSSTCGAGDVLLAFSFPPYARSTLSAIEAARERGVSVVAISDSPISPLRGKVDVLIPASVSGIGIQNSLVAAMSVANMIVNGVTERIPGALERYSETVSLLAGWDVYLLDPGGDA